MLFQRWMPVKVSTTNAVKVIWNKQIWVGLKPFPGGDHTQTLQWQRHTHARYSTALSLPMQRSPLSSVSPGTFGGGENVQLSVSIQSTQDSSVPANYSSHLIWEEGGRTDETGWSWREMRERKRGEGVWKPAGLVLSYRNNESHVATTCPVLSLLLLSASQTGWLCLYSIRPAGLESARTSVFMRN